MKSLSKTFLNLMIVKTFIVVIVTLLLIGCKMKPTVTTKEVTNIQATSITSGGNVISIGRTTVIVRGVCWSTSKNPDIKSNKTTDGRGTGEFTSLVTGLSTDLTYYIRAYATNEVGTAYGNEIIFKTTFTNCGSVTDIDGNTYRTIIIGSQCWMQENLKTTRYKDRSGIPLVTDNTAWRNLTTPAYCWYNNDEVTNKATYGALYNWYTVSTGNLCPTGWHVPANSEWTLLANYLGGKGVAGGKLKEAGTAHWISPNTGATNETGYTALPGGHRGTSGEFVYKGNYGTWWGDSAWFWVMTFGLDDLGTDGGTPRTEGYSVRCLKD